MLSVSRQRLYIELCNRKLHEITKLSIRATEEFRQTISEINEAAQAPELAELTIDKAYLTQPLFAHLIDRALSLVNLSADDISSQTLHNLLFPHQLEDGSVERQGILVKFLLGEITGGSTVPAENVDQYIKLLGDLLASLESFAEVSAAVDHLTYQDLAEALKYRADALRPATEKAKETNMQQAKEAFAKFKKAGTGALTKGAEIEDISSIL